MRVCLQPSSRDPPPPNAAKGKCPIQPTRPRRMSLVDPWLHEKNDGFPILYVRSHAARLPAGLVRDWLFRCRVMLEARGGRLDLKVRRAGPRGAGARGKP